MIPSTACVLKLWCLIDVCFVLSLIFVAFANSKVPFLSSKNAHLIIGFCAFNLKALETSFIEPLIGVISLKTLDRAAY